MTLHPLGRKVNHDPRSLAYPYVATTTTLASVTHSRMVPIFDQGSLGSCTGNAAVGAVGTVPLFASDKVLRTTLDEAFAVKVYSSATLLDDAPGAYPPTDTGSDGLSVAKVCKSLGLISGYTHCFSLAAVQTALQTTPIIIGINWYSGFDSPDANGLVKVSGTVRGGHEVCLVAIDVVAKTVTAANSWGSSWGAAGYFTFSWADLQRLLSEQGDATVLLPLTAPAPIPVPVPTPSTADAVLAVALHKWLDGSPWFYHPMQASARAWLTSKNL
jgi:hypothetical protein